jgi:hypothetical protein
MKVPATTRPGSKILLGYLLTAEHETRVCTGKCSHCNEYLLHLLKSRLFWDKTPFSCHLAGNNKPWPLRSKPLLRRYLGFQK